jgi:hypothetical protein
MPVDTASATPKWSVMLSVKADDADQHDRASRSVARSASS